MLALDDPYPFDASLRETDPVHRLADSDFYLVSTWALVNEAVTRPRDFCIEPDRDDGAGPRRRSQRLHDGGPWRPRARLGTADDPIHAVHRKMVLPTVVANGSALSSPSWPNGGEKLWSEGLGGDGSIDWVAAMSNRLPMTLVSRLIGLPAVDMEWLVTGAYATAQMLDGAIAPDQLQKAIAAATELAGYLADQFSRRASIPEKTCSAIWPALHAGELRPRPP